MYSGEIAAPTSRNEPVDALRLSEREKDQLLRQLDAAAANYTGIEKRVHARHPYRPPNGTIIRVEHQGGQSTPFLTCPRNLSAGGIGVIHAQYVHTGSKVSVTLVSLDNEEFMAEGHIVHCRHVSGKLHEIGIAFKHHIDIHSFVHIDGAEPAPVKPAEQPPQLTGQILYIDDAEEDRQFFQHTLKHQQLIIDIAPDAEKATHMASCLRYDLIITDYHLPKTNGAEFAAGLRLTGYDGPILLITADSNPMLVERAKGAGVNEIINKPLEPISLQKRLAHHLPRDTETIAEEDRIVSTRWTDPSLRPLIIKFLDALTKRSINIKNALLESDFPSIYVECIKIKGSAASYGYDSITRIATQITDAITQELEPTVIRPKVNQLLFLIAASAAALKKQH